MSALFSDKFYHSASSRTIDLAEAYATLLLEGGCSERVIRQACTQWELAWERGGVDSLSKYAPQILQEDLGVKHA